MNPGWGTSQQRQCQQLTWGLGKQAKPLTIFTGAAHQIPTYVTIILEGEIIGSDNSSEAQQGLYCGSHLCPGVRSGQGESVSQADYL